MVKVIGEKVYNTNMAKYIGKMSNESYSESLYLKKNANEYFLHGQGDAMSKYAFCVGDFLEQGENIIPLSIKDAREWAKSNFTGEEYERISEIILLSEIEDDVIVSVDWVLEKNLVNTLNQTAIDTGLSVSQIVTDLLRRAGY